MTASFLVKLFISLEAILINMSVDTPDYTQPLTSPFSEKYLFILTTQLQA